MDKTTSSVGQGECRRWECSVIAALGEEQSDDNER